MGAHVTFTWLKDTLVGCGTAAEVSDLNSLSCGNSVEHCMYNITHDMVHVHVYVAEIARTVNIT